MGSKVAVADTCAIVIHRNIALYQMSGFLLNMIIMQANYRDNIEIPRNPTRETRLGVVGYLQGNCLILDSTVLLNFYYLWIDACKGCIFC